MGKNSKMTLQQMQEFVGQFTQQWNVAREQLSAVMRLVGPELVQEEVTVERDRQKAASKQVIQNVIDDGVANGWLTKQPDDQETTGVEVVLFDCAGSYGTVVPDQAPGGTEFLRKKVGDTVKFENQDAVILSHYAYDRALQAKKQQEVIQAREAAVAAMKAESAVATGPQAAVPEANAPKLAVVADVEQDESQQPNQG